jgi:hypothetical protein
MDRSRSRLDPLVVLANLLPKRIVRHQRIDDRRGGKTADGVALHALEKVTAADFAVNITCVQVDRFRGNFLRLFHRDLPIKDAVTYSRNF